MTGWRRNHLRKMTMKCCIQNPWYFLIKRNTEDIEHYTKWWNLNDIFPVNNVGIVTARDNFAIYFNLILFKTG